MDRTRARVATALALLGFSALLAACVHPAAPPAAPQPATAAVVPPAPQYRTPTLAEYVETLDIFAHTGDPYYVHVLEADVFGDLGQHAVDCVAAISHRESTDYWTSYNRSGATGLTQLLGHADIALKITGSADVFNPFVNLVTARALSEDGRNWSPWTPAPYPC